MGLYDLVRQLPFRVEDYELDITEKQVSPRFTRRTTTVKLRLGVSVHGAEFVGMGEDVTYDASEHQPHHLPSVDLAGEWTLESFSKHLDGQELFPQGAPGQTASRDYRRGAFESAALDLALVQNGRSLADAVEHEPRPVRFVCSTSSSQVDDWLELYPRLRFKLDPTLEWTDEFTRGLAELDCIDVVDLKGHYQGTVVDNPADPELYARVAELFPEAWIEDPALTPETDPVLEPHRDRLTFDAPIHSWADVEALPFLPRCLNSKPSRFGTIARLFEFYDRCEERGIRLYGGGQYELGIGRGQIQLLASLFHPDASNDVAPAGYNAAEPVAGLPVSPIDPHPEPVGFRRAAP